MRHPLNRSLTNATFFIRMSGNRAAPLVNAALFNMVFLDHGPKDRHKRGVLHQKIVKRRRQSVNSAVCEIVDHLFAP
jgi:hypothetical protein